MPWKVASPMLFENRLSLVNMRTSNSTLEMTSLRFAIVNQMRSTVRNQIHPPKSSSKKILGGQSEDSFSLKDKKDSSK